ncbi:MAG TPA: alpha-2-macroglobulin family protein [Pirellulales bacterium]|jgi:hypothetical protein|nr:alpha-2-macroglobulin family protein [Pirellulales bacterium]
MLSPNQHVPDFVDAYLHKVLLPDDEEAVGLHCRHCPSCKVALEQASKRFSALQSLPTLPVSEQLLRTLQTRLSRRGRLPLSPRQRGVAGIAAVALLIGCFHLYFRSLGVSPYDLRVLGQTEVLSGSDASLRVLLLDHDAGQPMVGAPITIELVSADGKQKTTLCKAVTDSAGTIAPQLRWPDWKDGDYELRVTARVGSASERVTRGVKLRRDWQLMLGSDKPIYQPGQILQLRSLILRRPDLLPVAGREAVFTVSDPKGNKIFRHRQATSRFGIAFAECALADEIIEGAYQVECTVDDTASALTVDVRKFVPPKFRLDVISDRTFYQLGQKIAGTVQAEYFFGQPVIGGDVEVELRSHDVESTATAPIRAQTDANGKAAFELLPPQLLVGRPQHGGDAPIELVVTVRDTAGQVQSKIVSRLVTANPIHIEILPEMGDLVAGVANKIYILTSYPDGQPAKTRIAIGGLGHELVTNDLGAASIEVKPGATGLNWVVRATDKAGLTGRREIDLHAGQSKTDFLVRTRKAVYSGGETMQVLALGRGRAPVFLDLIRDGQTILTDSVNMSDGSGQFDFELPPELFGPVELCAYRYDDTGRPLRKTRLVYVRPAHSVDIATSLDQAEYRPGERAKLSFALSDHEGRPAPGALSLAAIDEAVFSVTRPAAGSPTTFSAREERLLQPVHAIYPWSPDLWSRSSRSGSALPSPEERERFEQALFSTTAGERGGDVEKKLQPYLEDSLSPFRALERPDWEELAQQIAMPPATFKMLQGRRGPHSLAVDSFAAKQLVTERWQREGLDAVIVAWFLWAEFCLAALAWYFSGQIARAAVGAGLLLLLIAVFFPVTEGAREVGRRTAALGNLNQIVAAADKYESNEADVGMPDATKLFSTDGARKPANVVASPRPRQWFSETLLWQPELITDDEGHATLDLDLTDTIASWRLSASAITAGGKMGAAEQSIRVFQPFFVDLDLPVAMTRGDEATVPVVVYNILDQPQTVELAVPDQPALTLEGEATRHVELAAHEVRAVHFRLRASHVGRHTLEVRASVGSIADVQRRTIEIVPDGNRIEKVVSGPLDAPAAIDVSVPETAVAGTARTLVKVYPSSFSQLVEGIDAIFERPTGCFEQTTSTLYSDVLALDYLRQNNQSLPAIEAKARQNIHLGCQRQLSFEIAGGGFDWFATPPANRTLSAYGLREMVDMASVSDVDPAPLERNRQWLLAQQQPDGTWTPQRHVPHEDAKRRGGDLDRLGTTAYVAWAVFAGRPAGAPSQRTLRYLRSHAPASIDDPYLLALMAKAIEAAAASPTAAIAYLDRLESLKHVSPDGKRAWWQLDAGRETSFFGTGHGGDVETTALAAWALIEAGRYPQTAHSALAWLVEQKDARGIWPSTQATVLALKALLAGTSRAASASGPRQIDIAVDDRVVEQVTIPAEEFNVVRQIDVTGHVGAGSHRLSITGRGDAVAGYQVLAQYYQPGAAAPAAERPLSIDLAYEHKQLTVGDAIGVTATIINNRPVEAPLVLVELPIPPGFAADADAWQRLVAEHAIAKYQLTPRCVIVYLRTLAPSAPLALVYRLNTSMPVKVAVPPATAYDYYNPDVHASSATTTLTVSAP